jgi:hypothetical protein
MRCDSRCGNEVSSCEAGMGIMAAESLDWLQCDTRLTVTPYVAQPVVLTRLGRSAG